MKSKKYYDVGAFTNSDHKIVEKEIKSIILAHFHGRLANFLAWHRHLN